MIRIKNPIVIEKCDLSIEDCVKGIKDDISILEMMGAHDPYSEELFSRYNLIMSSVVNPNTNKNNCP